MGCTSSKPPVKEPQAPELQISANPSPLSASEILQRVEAAKENKTITHFGFQVTYAWTSQRGYYPDALDKPNQDTLIISPKFQISEKSVDQALFGVFDGHGKDGHRCSAFVRDNLPKVLLSALAKDPKTIKGVKKSIVHAHLETNYQLHAATNVDDSLSGTTSITVLLKGRTIFVSNVGDSRAILLMAGTAKDRLAAKPLSSDQTPYRKDERARLKKYGARILSIEQIEGTEPEHENWGDLDAGDDIDEGGDPPRVWSPLGDYPGTAFSRSFGDMVAEELGVVADPEIIVRDLLPTDKYIVLASDGVFEFMTNQMVAEIVASHPGDPLAACKSIVSAAYNMWLQFEVRTDDITVIVLEISGLEALLPPAPPLHINIDGIPRESRAENSKVGENGLADDTLKGVTVPDSVISQSPRPVRRALSKEKKKMVIVREANDDIEDDAVIDMQAMYIPKLAEEEQAINSALKNNFLFQHLNSTQRASVIGVMQPILVQPGDWVIRQGDRGDKFYIVDTGRYEVRVQPVPGQDPTGGTVVHVYEPDNHPGFGELSLMYGKPRAATVIALTEGKLWALDRKVFRSVVMKSNSAFSRRDVIRALRKVELFKCLTLQQTQRMADLLNEVSFKKGDYIIRQGDPGDIFYLITSGCCDCTKNGANPGDPEIFLVQRKENEYFGERALLTAEPRAANVVAATDCKLMYISKSAFDEVLGSLASIINEDRLRRESTANSLLIAPKRLEGVTLLGIVSSDAFGPILLGSFGETSGVPTVSIRTFLLNEVDDQAMSASVLNFIEGARVVTASRKAPQSHLLPVVHSISRDVNAIHLIFLRPLVADLGSHLRTHNSNGGLQCSQEVAVYVGACVVSALESLHAQGIVYRSVQPEGLFVDVRGRVVLIDYRVCKIGGVGGKTFTICGASDYLSPEQISQVGHCELVDFWALGVLLYELILGSHPFTMAGEVATYNKITSFGSRSFPELSFPSPISDNAKHIINKLVVATPEARLGAGPKGFQNLKAHPFFETMDWSLLGSNLLSPLQSQVEAELKDLLRDGVDKSVIDSFRTEYSGSGWDRNIPNVNMS